ncbi:hypothetical protein LCGC14_1917920 [marine sediment metagenome]|uniref:Uncharacterized protein n=1 Tax=marine sediment metagenome TaxID=412755 RepID=A0A0F9I5M6_9ZZZZ
MKYLEDALDFYLGDNRSSETSEQSEETMRDKNPADSKPELKLWEVEP